MDFTNKEDLVDQAIRRAYKLGQLDMSARISKRLSEQKMPFITTKKAAGIALNMRVNPDWKTTLEEDR